MSIEEDEVEEEVAVEVEVELSWHQLQHRVDFKVLLFMQISLVECCLIRVHRTLLFLVVIV